MTFFYDLNKRMAELANKQTLAEGKSAKPDFLDIDKDGNKTEPMKKAVADKAQKVDEAGYSAKAARAGKDIGKPGKNFEKIAKSAAERYGSKEKGEKVAGAVLAKLRAKEDVNEADKDNSQHLTPATKNSQAVRQHQRKQMASDFEVLNRLEKQAVEKAKKIAAQKTNEADMEEGNEFSGALARAKAAGASEFEVDGKKYKVTTEGFKEMDAYLAQKKKEAGTGKFDKKQISTGTVYTRRYEEEPDIEDDLGDAPKRVGGSGIPKKKGRKAVGAGKGKKIGAKSRGTSKLASKDSIKEGTTDDIAVAARILGRLVGLSERGQTIEPKELAAQLRLVHERLNRLAGGFAVDTLRPETKPVSENDSIALINKGEYDREGEMAKQQIHTIVRAAKKLHSMLGDDDNLPEWVQKKITLAQNYIDGVADYMTSVDAEQGEGMPIAEKAVSQAQRKAAGIAYAAAKGDIPKSELRGASKEMAKMPAGELKKFAKTKEKGLPEKVKETDLAPKAKGGIQFGKGIYESMNSQVESMITESMNVNVSMSTGENSEPTKSITVNAEGADAEVLAQLLNLAGIKNKSSGCGCGQTPCGCDQVDEAYGDTKPTENEPDYPTDAETTGKDDELLRRWSSGLNGPKSTGQTTIPVIASQTNRQVSEETKVDKLGMNLYAELKSFKAK